MNLMWASAVLAIVLSLILYPLAIPLLHRLKFGQNIRSDGPQTHLKKAGTPTMGGIILVPAALLAALISGAASTQMWCLMLAFVGFGLIGFADDMLKIAFHRSLGLSAIQKLIGQFLLAFIFLYIIVETGCGSTDVILPFGGYHLELGFFYYPLMAFFFVGMVNAVNLTDGLDGLCGGVSAIVFAGYAIICSIAPVAGIQGYHELGITAFAICGACIGFLYFNKYPAKIFMGDTGSLALGGAVVAIAALTKTELPLILIGAVYLAEACSVMLQVFSFKVFGKRIFLMSPLHHHFEMKGWKETKVVIAFWFAALLCTVIGVLLSIA